jgi:hypothetical protein
VRSSVRNIEDKHSANSGVQHVSRPKIRKFGARLLGPREKKNQTLIAPGIGAGGTLDYRQSSLARSAAYQEKRKREKNG